MKLFQGAWDEKTAVCRKVAARQRCQESLRSPGQTQSRTVGAITSLLVYEYQRSPLQIPFEFPPLRKQTD